MADVRLLPHDDQAEMSVLASILVEAEAKSTDSLKQIREALPPEDCRRTAHKKIIATYIKHFDEDLPTDLEDIASPCKRDDARDDFEGYLKEIRGEHPASTKLSHHIGVVKDLAKCRRLLYPINGAIDLLWKGHLKRVDPIIASLQTTCLNGTPTHPAVAMESAIFTGEQIFEAFKKGLQSSHLIEDIWPGTACCWAGCAEPKVLREILRRELDELYDLSNMDSEAQAEIKERQTLAMIQRDVLGLIRN